MITDSNEAKAFEQRVQHAVASPAGSDASRWLVEALRDRADGRDPEASQEAHAVFHIARRMFDDDLEQVAQRFQGQVARVDILDIFETRLHGRESAWGDDWYELDDAQRARYADYDAYVAQRRQESLRAGKDWPACYAIGVDNGTYRGSFREFVLERLLQAAEEELSKQRNKKAYLGVVFVHGVGTQRRGTTLQRFGDPIIRWTRDWLEELNLEFPRWQRRSRMPEREFAYTGLEDTHLRGGDEETPPRATLALPLLKERWLLTEAWWADEVQAPTTRRLVLWLAFVTPIMVLTHLSRMLHWRSAGLRKRLGHTPTGRILVFLAAILAFAATTLVATVASLVLQAAALLLGLLAIIPVAAVRRPVKRILLVLRTTIGDSLSFTDSPVSRAAILSKVEQAVTYATQRAERVVVIAHSQGAALAHQVLARSRPDKVRLLATFGAGIHKLHTLHGGGRRRLLFEALAVVMFLAPAYLLYLWLFAPALTSLDFYLALFLLGTYFLAWSLPLKASTDTRRLALDGTAWVDYFASKDPVSNGPMAVQGGVVQSREVHNLESVLSDHNAYWKNRDEFIPRLVRDLGAHGLTDLFASDRASGKDLDALAVRRCRRLTWLRLLRGSFALGILIALASAWDALGDIARQEILPHASSAWVAAWSGRIEGGIGVAAQALGLGEATQTRWTALGRELPYQLAGALAVVASLGIWALTGLGVWHWWNRNSMLHFSRGGTYSIFARPDGTSEAPLPIVAGSTLALLGVQLAPLAAATLWPIPRPLLLALALAAAAVAFLGSSVLEQGANMAIGPMRTWSQGHVPMLRYVIPISGVILVIGWLTITTSISQSILQPYRLLGTGIHTMAGTVAATPELLAPFMLQGFWLMGALVTMQKHLVAQTKVG